MIKIRNQGCRESIKMILNPAYNATEKFNILHGFFLGACDIEMEWSERKEFKKIYNRLKHFMRRERDNK